MRKGFEAQEGGPAYAPSAVSSSVALGGPTERLLVYADLQVKVYQKGVLNASFSRLPRRPKGGHGGGSSRSLPEAVTTRRTALRQRPEGWVFLDRLLATSFPACPKMGQLYAEPPAANLTG